MRSIWLILCFAVLLVAIVGCPPSTPGNGGDNGPDDNDNGSGTIPDGPLPEDPDDGDDEDITALLEISPTSHNFGSVNVGGFSVARVFTVTNVGDEPLFLAGAELDGLQAAEFLILLDNCRSQNLVTHQICTVTVQFTPRTTGAHTADLRIVPVRMDVPRPEATLVGQGF